MGVFDGRCLVVKHWVSQSHSMMTERGWIFVLLVVLEGVGGWVARGLRAIALPRFAARSSATFGAVRHAARVATPLVSRAWMVLRPLLERFTDPLGWRCAPVRVAYPCGRAEAAGLRVGAVEDQIAFRPSIRTRAALPGR